MLKVAENLKCKHGLWCVSKQNEKTFGAFVCQLNHKECKDVCERFVNKWKEWEQMMQTPVIKLEPCPMCGADAELYKDSAGGHYLTEVICTKCKLGLERWGENSVEEAVEAWNRRT